MKSLKVGLLLCCIVFFVTCGKQETVRFMPHNWQTCELKDGVKSIKETTYQNASKKSILYPKRYIEFDTRGQLLIDKRYTKSDSVVIEYLYDKGGRLEEITGFDALKEFIPEYNAHGDLVRETYVQNDELKHFFEYSYDTLGRIVTERLCYDESIAYPTEYTYKGDRLVKQISYEETSETHYTYNNAGYCTQKRVYEGEIGEERKLTAQYAYTYKFDRNGNWIERTEKRRGKVTSFTAREIEYHDNLTQSVASNTKKATLSTSNSYFAQLKLRIAMANYTTGAPAVALTIIVILLTLLIAAGGIYLLNQRFEIFKLLTYDTGYDSRKVKKMWMFRWGVYAFAGIVLATLLVSFIAAVLLLFILGAAIWLLMWICKIIFWITVVGGTILLILGLLGVFFSSGEGRFGCGSVIIGGIIAACSDFLGDLGESLVEWGTETMNTLNLFQWGVNLFSQFWDLILLTFFAPMALFLSIACICIILAFLLMGSEKLMMRIYSVRRPCPHCGSTATPHYIINKRNGEQHPVSLHPGIYGIFHHKVGDTLSVPTMLANGKGKLDRVCADCKEKILADAEHTFGTEIHVGIVGNRSSGKSYLLYSGLALLKKELVGQISQIDKEEDTDIDAKYQRIAALGAIQTDTSLHHAVQLMYKSKRRMPFHLFFYDVAGEKFDAGKRSSQYDMDFYQHVQSIVFVVDPAMIDVTGTPISEGYEQWLKKNGTSASERFDIEGIFGSLYNLIERYNKNVKNIDFNFVCVKSDMGYFKACGYPETPSEKEIETFMCTELGQANLVHLAKNYFKTLHFYEVSVVENDKSKLKKLFFELLAQRNVSI